MSDNSASRSCCDCGYAGAGRPVAEKAADALAPPERRRSDAGLFDIGDQFVAEALMDGVRDGRDEELREGTTEVTLPAE